MGSQTEYNMLENQTMDDKDTPLKHYMENKWKILPEYLKTKGLINEHILSYNDFLEVGLQRIVEANKTVTSELNKDWYFRYLAVKVGTPTINDSFVMDRVLTPFECRLRNMTYSAPIIADIEYTQGKNIVQRTGVVIGKLPIMLKSSHCVLHNKSEEEIIKFKECPLDPGGYFIVKGTERLVIMQEQLTNNQMMLDSTSDKNFLCSVVSSTYTVKSRTVVVGKKEKLYLRHSSLKEDIPIFLIFKSMGIGSDVDIIKYFGQEKEIIHFLLPSLQEFISLKRETTESALEYLIGRLKILNTNLSRDEQLNEVRKVIKNMILSHVQVNEGDYTTKAIMLGMMTRRVILAYLNLDTPDNKDYYGNKRIDLAGPLISILFEDLFKQFNGLIRKEAEKFMKSSLATRYDPSSHLKTNLITNGVNVAIGSGNWVIKRFSVNRAGITQSLSRLTHIACLGMMTRVNSLFEKSRKVAGPRSLQCSTYGMLCPIDTPEGESCGLIKTSSLSCHITLTDDDSIVKNLAFMYGTKEVAFLTGKNIYHKDYYHVFINGSLIGFTSDKIYLVNSLRKARQACLFSPFISVSINDTLRHVIISSQAGRLCRPHIRVENKMPLLNDQHLTMLIEQKIDFDYFIKNGLIEYLDVNEEFNSVVAVYEDDLTLQSTHLEIAPFSILGICAGLIPFSNHNQSPRNTYQCAMVKQAMGTIALNQIFRIDTLSYGLVYPQNPTVKTKVLNLMKLDQLPGGQNAILAVMSYNGYDIEDAVTFNKASLDRGFGRCHLYKKEQISLKSYSHQAYDITCVPSIKDKNNVMKYQALDNDGICAVGARVENFDVLVCKLTPEDAESYNNALNNEKNSKINYKHDNLILKAPIESYVDKVSIATNDEDHRIIKICMRQTRRPEMGDKFCSRHGQKGVIGSIVNQEDLPFSEKGIVPDILMNPHGFPSRMTVGKLLELISGKAGLLSGKYHDGTVFENTKLKETCQLLEEAGYARTGKDILISGTTGQLIPCYIYEGPVFYQKLKHMVIDKIHARATGPRTSLTRQPTEGRAKNGGLRIGEMERDCFIGYGASKLVEERLMVSGDGTHVDICESCGLLAYSGECKFCTEKTVVSQLYMPFSFKLLLQELMSMNISPRIRVKD